jgi:hypothetical protein
MPAKVERRWPTLVWTADFSAAVVNRAASAGDLHRLARGLYTPRSDVAEVAAREWLSIVAREYPGAVLVDASARANRPTNGRLFVDHPRRTGLELPGLTILPRSGPGHVAGDGPGPEGIWMSSIERGMLDNLADLEDRVLGPDGVREWVEFLLTSRGVAYLNGVRDRAHALAPTIRRQNAFKRLNSIIATALVTNPSKKSGPSEPVHGNPVDPNRLARFTSLATQLAGEAPELHPALSQFAGRRALLTFYEAYFSNDIEGTEFSLDEAADIVFELRIPANRPLDAHDILGTYQLATNPEFAAVTTRDAAEFVELIIERHRVLMADRSDVGPGQLRQVNVRAGGTNFPRWELVRGTLLEGFDLGAELLDPFARAVYVHFLVSEVHPFADGNGRVSRLAMNAELEAAGMIRIVVPTGYREDYLGNLNAASGDGHFAGMVTALRHVARWTALMDWSSREAAEPLLESTNALMDPREAVARGVKVTLPNR